MSTSYTPKKGFYKKKTVRGFKKKSDALNYERVIMIQLKQKAKYNFVLGLKLEDVWKEYSDYMRLTEWKDSPQCELCIYKNMILNLAFCRDLLQI
ncbi:MAG: Arm DNA-binding domain-containing protein [[Clostridium] innocuum]